MAENPLMSGPARLRELLVARSLHFGDITLSNGQKSKFYFDCKTVTLDPEGASLVADAFLEVIDRLPVKPAAIGGQTLGADPIVGAIMMRALERGQKLDTFYVRKQAKKHGTMKWVENPPERGTKVVIVDDVITTGNSALNALDRAAEIGCEILAVIGLVDREEGGAAAIRERCANYVALYTLEDFPEIAQTLRREEHAYP
jgi:orotate phosphoribosyltransferase